MLSSHGYWLGIAPQQICGGQHMRVPAQAWLPAAAARTPPPGPVACLQPWGGMPRLGWCLQPWQVLPRLGWCPSIGACWRVRRLLHLGSGLLPLHAA